MSEPRYRIIWCREFDPVAHVLRVISHDGNHELVSDARDGRAQWVSRNPMEVSPYPPLLRLEPDVADAIAAEIGKTVHGSAEHIAGELSALREWLTSERARVDEFLAAQRTEVVLSRPTTVIRRHPQEPEDWRRPIIESARTRHGALQHEGGFDDCEDPVCGYAKLWTGTLLP